MRSPNRVKTQTKFAALLILASLLLFFFIRPPFTPHYQHKAATLHAKKENQRADALFNALSSWTAGPPPSNVIFSAAACTPRDAADAILRHFNKILPQSGVIDIGANKGYPVTTLALRSSPKWVISVEPDQRNFHSLNAVKPLHSTLFKPVLGAVSDKPGRMQIAFHKTRDDFTCFNCLNTSRDEVTAHTVDVHTVDSLVTPFQENIALLKTDTQGHEASVLSGATRLFQSGNVHAVLMEFDPKLLRKFENAHTAVSTITQAGLRCMSLVFAGLKEANYFPYFGEEVTVSSLPEFWKYVTEQGKYTDLFCLRK